MCGHLGSEATHNRDGESIFVDQAHTQHQEQRERFRGRSKCGVPRCFYVEAIKQRFYALPGILLRGIATFADLASVNKVVAVTAKR